VLLPAPVPHLDRVFDYAVPESLRSASNLGRRVRVRFAGRLATGIIVGEQQDSDFELQPIRAVLGPPVLPPATAELTRAVAQRYVGNWSDVVTAAIPPRHAGAERAVTDDHGQLLAASAVTAAALQSEPADRHVLSDAPRQALSIPWSWDWTRSLAAAIAHTLSRGKRVLVIVADDADLRRAQQALNHLDRPVSAVRISADTGAYARYRAYLAAISGQADVVFGTRAAAFTHIPNLGLMWMWRDVDSALVDPQAPYWHAREVVGMRAMADNCSVIYAGWTRSVEVQRLVDIGWLVDTSPARSTWREDLGRVRLPDSVDQLRDPVALTARVPHAAIDLVRRHIAEGPVLVQVPRKGYVPLIACSHCRTLVLCPACGAAAQLSRDGVVQCRCGALPSPWVCPICEHTAVRAVRVGSGRTAVELSRAVPRVKVIRSDSEAGVVAEVSADPALVVATPGAEPVAMGGYAAGLLLDGDVLAHGPWLRAPEEALERWSQALSNLRPEAPALLIANPAGLAAQALVRVDPVGFAAREYQLREEAHLPPTQRFFAISGPGAADVATEVTAQAGQLCTVLGPVPTVSGDRWLVRCDYRDGAQVAAILNDMRRRRSEQRLPVFSVRADPGDL
jgi:primosomal protein N' (replication factor Y) (superfamily II helicase)